MAKNQPASKDKTICQKLVNVISTFPAFRSVLRINPASSNSALRHDHKPAATSPSGMSKKLAKTPEEKTASEVPIMFDTSTPPKKKDRPTNQHNQRTVKDGRYKNVTPAVPMAAGPAAMNPARDTGKKQEGFQGKGGEGRKLWSAKTDDFNDYIDRAGTRIRTTSLADDGRKPILAKDSFNDAISDFITRARHKFHHTASDVDSNATKAITR